MDWDEKTVVIKCNDVFGSLVVFEKKNYDKHKRYHAELRNESFCPTRIMHALKKPTLTIKGRTPHSLCYYLEEYAKNGIMLYTKVVVHEEFRSHPKKPICKIKTAHHANVIKETDYGHKIKYH